MTQIIVTIEDNSPISLIKKAISLLRGVSRVVVQKSPVPVYAVDCNETLSEIPPEIMGLIGIASKINDEEIASDDRLSYILSK